MWNCPKCKQTIPDLLSVKIDEERIKLYKEQTTNAINKRIQLRAYIKEYNRTSIFSHTTKLYLCEWDIEDSFISQIEEEYGFFKKRKVIEKVITPRKPLIEYIECPMCSYRQYLEDIEEKT